MNKPRKPDALAQKESDRETVRPKRMARPEEMAADLNRPGGTRDRAEQDGTNAPPGKSGTYAVFPEDEPVTLSGIGAETRGKISGAFAVTAENERQLEQITSMPPSGEESDPEYVIEAHLIGRINAIFRLYLNIIENERPALLSPDILDRFVYAFRHIITTYFKIYRARFHAKVAYGIEEKLMELMETRENWKDRVGINHMMEQVSEIFALPAEAFGNPFEKKRKGK